MSKPPTALRGKHPKGKPPTSSLPLSVPWRKKWVRAASLVGKFLTAVGVLFGVIEGILFFYPKVTVRPLQPLNASDPLSAPFEIENAGSVPIYDVDTWCRIPNVINNGKNALVMVILNEKAPVLRAGEHLTVNPCSPPVAERKAARDIETDVGYRPQLTWFHRWTRSFFVAQQDAAGQWHWLVEPISWEGSN